MADAYSASLIDSGGQVSTMMFGASSSAAKIETFLTAHSKAGLLGVNALTDIAVTPTAAVAGSDVQRKCFVTAHEPSLGTVRFAIPAPKIVGEQTEEGERLSEVNGQAICDAWGAMLGLGADELEFVVGVFAESE